MDYQNITGSVDLLARRTGQFLLESLGKLDEGMIRSKGQMDFVTDIDKESEKRLVEGLSEIIPEAGFIAEEGTVTRRGSRFNWVVDPLDGTTNFIHGVSPFAISIALMEDDELVSGVIYDPARDECFAAYRDGPSTLNGKTIQVSERERLADSLIATGFPYTDFSRLESYMETLLEMMAHTHGIRRLGSAAVDLAYVACGRYDAFWEYHLKPWDVAAGTLLIKQAGGTVCDFFGGQDFLFGSTFVATNGSIHEEFMSVLEKYF
jgi:myo-inositol-1(or 4)-monophosphatase